MLDLSVILAVNELRGDVANSRYYIKEFANVVAVIHGNYITLEEKHDDTEYICTVDEFNKCVTILSR